MDLENLTLKQLVEIIVKEDSAALKDILLHYKDHWNKLMVENKKHNFEIRIKNIILKDKDLKGINLADTVIEDSDFSDSDLSDSDLSNTVIARSNFISAKLQGANLYSARVSQTNLSRARLYEANIRNIALTGSVNLFETYLVPNEAELEETYKTTAHKTKRDFKKIEYYEHFSEPDEDHY